MYLTSWLSESARNYLACFRVGDTWCSGITSASHAEDPGLNPQCVHAQHAACSLAGERLLSSSCHLHRQRFSCAVCRPCILLVHTAVCTGLGFNALNHPASIFPLLRTSVPERVSQKLRGMFSCGWHLESSGSAPHGVVVLHPLRMRKGLGSIPGVSMHSMLHAPWLKKDFSRPPATSTESVSAVLFVGLVSCLSIPLSARAREGSTLQNAGQDDLGGFSTPILLSCFCSKKCSKSSRVHFPIAEDVCTWLPGWASQPETTWHVFVWVTPWEQWLRGTWCSGITSASHAEDPGLNPQCVHAQHAACFVAGERLLSSSCHLHRQRFSCAVCRPCILLVHTAVCTG